VSVCGRQALTSRASRTESLFPPTCTSTRMLLLRCTGCRSNPAGTYYLPKMGYCLVKPSLGWLCAFLGGPLSMAPTAEVEIAPDNTVLSRVMSRPTGVFTMYTTCLHQRPPGLGHARQLLPSLSYYIPPSLMLPGAVSGWGRRLMHPFPDVTASAWGYSITWTTRSGPDGSRGTHR
jgi:hypothetical protein